MRTIKIFLATIILSGCTASNLQTPETYSCPHQIKVSSKDNTHSIYHLTAPLVGESRLEVIERLRLALNDNQWSMKVIDDELGIISATRSNSLSIAPLSITVVRDNEQFSAHFSYSAEGQEQPLIREDLCNVIASYELQP